MNLEKMYLEEDLFPREITSYKKRNYGFLFYNVKNKNSFDSNHALIYRDKISDLLNSNTLFFVAFYEEKSVGMTHCHVTNDVCRVDYLLVSKECRNIGVGRALISCFVEYCRKN